MEAQLLHSSIVTKNLMTTRLIDKKEGENKDEHLETMKRGEKGEKSISSLDSRLDRIEQLLKESSMFNNCFNDYAGFITILKGNCLLSSPC